MRTFRHAVSLDERRAKFKANLWNRPTAKEQALGVEGQKPDVPTIDKPPSASKAEKKPHTQKKGSLRAMEQKFSGSSDRPTDIEEVDFPWVFYPDTTNLGKF